MGDTIRHECGLALVRTLKPLPHYHETYGDAAWGLRRLSLLLEKQHNRGQDGAGVGVVKFDMPAAEQFLRRVRSDKRNALERVLKAISSDLKPIEKAAARGRELDERDAKLKCEFLGEVYIGHLRYGTHSGRSVKFCHPYIRKSNVASRSMMVAGNFNVTNAPELFRQLHGYGLDLVGDSDTQVILERIGYCLDREHDHLEATMGPGSFVGLDGRELARQVSDDLNIVRVMENAGEEWDGGYVFAGLLGNGDAFICRDPSGIRPGYYYHDDEVFAAASERVALTNVLNAEPEQVHPIPPGHVIVIKRSGEVINEPFRPALPLRQCTFERIYFSRGNDHEIYRERKSLGRSLAPRVLEAVDHDVDNCVFSFVPNTAETAYLGLMEGVHEITHARDVDRLWGQIQSGEITRECLMDLVQRRARGEKIAHKDARLRTFITHDAARRDLVAHIYDITRGVVKPTDTLVVLDDSIVRGTTLRESIITMLSRLRPKRIIIVSSAPPIMYPDCYGIDMSQLGRFVAFEAAVSLIHQREMHGLLEEVERDCLAQAGGPLKSYRNHVRRIYEPFSLDEISKRVAEIVRPAHIAWDGPVDVIYQSVDGLRAAMPGHTGDWYFTGDYPTPGGFKVLNTSFLNWRKRSEDRAY